MAYTLQQLSDLEEIRTLKHRYFRGIDTADMALLSTLFTEDVYVEYRGGTYRVRLSGRDNMIDFLANSFHSGTVAMHHGHMPEITFVSENEAKGIWYLEDIFINLEEETHTIGTALYYDDYRRENGVWYMSRTEYDRVIEVITPIDPNARVTAHRLGQTGRKPEERSDITHLIEWDETA